MSGALESAEEEIQRLRSRLKESEEQVQQAAHAGLDLLNQQVELQTQLEEQRVEMTNTIEILEQDKFSLKREVELRVRMLESLKSEYDSSNDQHTQHLHHQEERLTQAHNTEVHVLKNQIINLQADLGEAQLKEKQLKHKLEVMTETLNLKLDELRSLNEQKLDTISSELTEMHLSRLELQSIKAELALSLQEAQYKEQQLDLTNRSLKCQLLQFKEEKEEREKEAVSWFNALGKSRQVNLELQVQLDQAQQQAQDPNSKGNSLFAELEDKRAEMEKRLISMKIQHQSLQKQHGFSKQQLHRMKVQIATLMQLQGTRADPAQLERLQSMLTEKNEEIHNLVIKLQRLEKSEMLLKSQPSVPSRSDVDIQDETYYTDLLKLKLNNSVRDAERLGDELSLQRMKSLSESQRALELERKLYSSEQLLKQARSDKIKLQLCVEELRYKYEPNECNKNNTQRRKREKLPVGVIKNEPNEHSNYDKTAKLEPPPTLSGENQHVAILRQIDMQPTEDRKSEAPPAKCARIGDMPPVEIPNTPSSPMMAEKEEKKILKDEGDLFSREVDRDEDGRKKNSVEIIHVRSKNCPEDQCSQQ
ncbi:protein Spindly [Gadus macrocephalus]|uniref:protein Spindly n=1 Tax=Gadus macrocephalus TaxID=80720 RepID=UPI0028CB3BCA|nr:protein Spindly [Gadus macrocephalus]